MLKGRIIEGRSDVGSKKHFPLFTLLIRSDARAAATAREALASYLKNRRLRTEFDIFLAGRHWPMGRREPERTQI